MAALTGNQQNISHAPYVGENVARLPVGVDAVYEGGLVENSSGDVVALSGAGTFEGVALEHADNSGGSAGDLYADVLLSGVLKGVAVAGSTPARGDRVYCATDNVADLTIVSTSATEIGHIQSVNADGTYDVRFYGRTAKDQNFEARITTNTA